MSSHQFALYVPRLSEQLSTNNKIAIKDTAVMHRIHSVLRLEAGEPLILFDQYHNALVHVSAVSKKEITVDIVSVYNNVQLRPIIKVILPLLKKDALEQALYSCVELGAHEIYLITTAKTHHTWTGSKERERLEKIIIAACEQSKYFTVPTLYDPVSLDQLLSIHKVQPAIFFDPQGIKLVDVINSLVKEYPRELWCMIGPEADLNESEKDLLKDKGFIFCALTPTVLRAKDALIVGLGMLRSVLR